MIHAKIASSTSKDTVQYVSQNKYKIIKTSIPGYWNLAQKYVSMPINNAVKNMISISLQHIKDRTRPEYFMRSVKKMTVPTILILT